MGFNKKVLSKAVSELGKAKAPAKPRDITVDPMGYWNPANQGKPVRIPGQGNPKGVDITMHNVNQPIWAQPNVGPGTIMYPEDNRHFSGASYVDETQIGKKGGTLKSKKYSKSMSATNKLFAKNKLFKNKKSKIFDPNAEFKKGGSKLGPINLDPNPLSHYELNYGFNLPTKQEGGVNVNPWLYTNMQENEGRDPGQIIGLGADFQHKSGLHGSTNVELPFFNKDAVRNSNMELGYTKRYKNLVADASLQNSANPYEKINPSLNTGIGYNTNIGKHIGFGVAANNNMVPGKLWNPGIQAGMTYNFQDGGENEDEYMDLTDEEIQAYRDAGYEVDELPEAQEGGPKDTIIYPPGDSEYMNQPALNYDILEMQNQKARRNYEQYLKDSTDPTNIQRTSPSFQQKYFMNKDVVNAKTGGFVQHELVKAQKGLTKKPLEISDPKEFAYRDRAYKDSLDMYKNDLLATKYYDLANNPAYDDDFFINAKKGSAYIEKMKKIKKNSPAKFGSVFAKQKKPVQPVVLKQPVSNNTPIKSKNVESKKPLEISDPKEFALRKAAYADSLKLYNESMDDLKGMSNTKFIKAGKYTNETPQAGWSQGYINSKKDDLGNTVKGKIKPVGVNYSTRNSDNEDVVSYMYKKPVQPVKFVPKKDKPKAINTASSTTTEPVSALPLKPIERFTSPEQTIIPSRPYVKAVKPSANKGVWSGGSEEQFPTGLNTSDWERKTREYQQQQRANKPIAKAQTGLTKKPLIISDPKEFAYRQKMYADSLNAYNSNPPAYNSYENYKKSMLNEYNKSHMISGYGIEKPVNKDVKYSNFKSQPIRIVEFTATAPNLDPKSLKSIGRKKLYTKDIPVYKKPIQPVQLKKNTTLQKENIIQQETNAVDSLPFLPITHIPSLNPEFIPQRTIQPESYSNPNRQGRWSDGSNEQFPKGLNTSDWERKTREYQEQQRGNKTVAQVRKEGGDVESWEDELDDREIALLRRAGYVVEDLD